MMQPHDGLWYIDSWDVRGGSAFASHFRQAPYSERIGAEGHTVFLTMPALSLETITDRGVALAASRGSFQAGLFLDGEAVPFRQLGDVVEIIRRAYLASGGGDGTGGGPAPDEPPEDPEDPTGSVDTGGSADREVPMASAVFLQGFSDFTEKSIPLELGMPGRPHSWRDTVAPLATSTHIEEPLLRAFVQVLYEILRRLPGRGRPVGLDWWRSFHAWSCALSRLHLNLELHNLGRNDKRVEQRFVRALLRSEIDDYYARCVAEYGFRSIFYDLHWPRSGAFNDGSCAASFDLLWALPLPKRFRPLLAHSAANPTSISLGHLFTLSLASPRLVSSDPSAVQLTELIILASAITAAPNNNQGLIWNPERGRGDHELRRAARREVLVVAGRWLETALPQLALPLVLEKLIGKSAGLSYAA